MGRGTTITAAGAEQVARVAAVTRDPDLLWLVPANDKEHELWSFLVDIQAPVSRTWPGGVLVGLRDFHHRQQVRWPPGVQVRAVEQVTAAGHGSGRLQWLVEGTRALGQVGVESLTAWAEGDGLSWLLAPGESIAAQACLHRLFVERGLDTDPQKTVRRP